MIGIIVGVRLQPFSIECQQKKILQKLIAALESRFASERDDKVLRATQLLEISLWPREDSDGVKYTLYACSLKPAC